jgi:cytochrome c556
MRRTIALSALAVAVVFGLSVRANEKPTPEFQATMKSNGATLGALGAHIKAKEYDLIAMDAATLQGNLAKVEAFFVSKKMDDAVAFAKNGAKAAADLEAAAKAKNDDGIAAAQKGMTCGGCHMAHRERLADMTFEIK